MGNNKCAAFIMSQMLANAFVTKNIKEDSVYKTDWEPIRMKGLSAEEMGTANSRKKSRKKRKKGKNKKVRK